MIMEEAVIVFQPDGGDHEENVHCIWSIECGNDADIVVIYVEQVCGRSPHLPACMRRGALIHSLNLCNSCVSGVMPGARKSGQFEKPRFADYFETRICGLKA